ncbi:MAG: pitrilysin family protein [Syntrophomonadaceae bacterium]|nr:pitrilysin family protein [Syntrophomonadaceae bacterium]
MINCWELDSKASLVVEEIPYVRSVAIGVYIKVGSRHEDWSLSGASHFIEHMLFKGTDRRSAREIAESFEGIGGQLNAFTAKEHTCVYARTLDEHLDTALDIIFDMLFHSSFAPKDFETEKGVIVEEINMYEDTPDDLVHDVFSQQLWQGHSMGRPILGTLDSVQGFKREEIYDFYRRAYVPANMIIAIAGNVDAARVKEKLESYLKQDMPDSTQFINIEVADYEPFIKMVAKDTEQVQICLGLPGISYQDKRRYTQNIMNSILGGGISSRLFQTIREELGLAYSVYSYPSNYSDTGSYIIHIGTGPGKVAQFFEVFHAEIHKFRQQGVMPGEVERTQQLIKSSMLMGMESVMNRMNRLGKSILMYGQVIPVDEVLEQIYAVTPEKVNHFADEVLDLPRFSLAAVGSAEVLPMVENEYKKWWK